MSDPSFPRTGRLAGIDYGTVRTGIAVCDPDRILVSPLEIWQRAPEPSEVRFFQELVRRERLVGLVVGLPIHCDGGESDKSREARVFARWLHATCELPVRLFDERFTTSAATQKLRASGVKGKKRKQRLDAVAAQVLLEAFLEAERYGQRTPGQGLDDAAGSPQLPDSESSTVDRPALDDD
jgi:putative Holliday junction resolvase